MAVWGGLYLLAAGEEPVFVYVLTLEHIDEEEEEVRAGEVAHMTPPLVGRERQKGIHDDGIVSSLKGHKDSYPGGPPFCFMVSPPVGPGVLLPVFCLMLMH